MKKNKTFSIYCVLLFSIFLLQSCTKKITSQHGFKFTIASKIAGVNLLGGSFIKAVSADSNVLVQLDATNSATFESKKWELQAIAFEGPTFMSGKKYCGVLADVNLSGAEQSIQMNISEANCMTEPFISLVTEINNHFGLKNVVVNNVQVLYNQLVIQGDKLDTINNVTVNGPLFNENFTIVSQTPTQIIAEAVKNISFDVAKVLSLVLSDAKAAANFTIDFSLCNSTLNGHGFDCILQPNDKDVLSYDAASGKWKPRAINGLSYQGVWDATTAFPAAVTIGDYYIVNVANGIYHVGDWIVYNGTTFDLMNNSNAITSVFGRTGAIAATKGDYDLNKLTDVDLVTTPPTFDQVLKYNGTKWIPGNVVSNFTETDPSVLSFAKTALPYCAAGDVLTTNGSNFTCVPSSDPTVQSFAKNSLPYCSAGWFLTTTGSTLSCVSMTSSPNYNTDIVNTMLYGYYMGNNSVVNSSDSIVTAFGKLQTQLGFKVDSNNYSQTITALTINGLTDPMSPNEAANKNYVDFMLSSAQAWLKTGNDISYSTGNVGIGITNPIHRLEINGDAIIDGIRFGKGGTTTDNLAIGNSTFNPNAYGFQNVALGNNDLSTITSGSNNTAIGYGIGTLATTASQNTGLGYAALNWLATGNSNTGIGSQALYYISTGSGNTTLGFNAGSAITSGSNNIVIGSNTGASIATLSNNIIISDGTGTEKVKIDATGNLGIGQTAPLYKLDVAGDMNASGFLRLAGIQVCTPGGCTSSSDKTLKENIVHIDQGLEKILLLEGVRYNWKDKNKFGDKKQVGLIAQEVEKVFPEVVTTDAKSKLKSIAYDHLIAPVIEAIKCLYNKWQHDSIMIRKEIKSSFLRLENENEALKKENQDIKLRLEKLEKQLSKK
jgi:hypothetical protein